jgi:acyl-CoA reductase-like NAD-dependent aldehyde dehydrogenase
MSSNRIDIDGISVSPDHFINGERVSSPHTFDDRSPLDWQWKLADVARGGEVEADAAIRAAQLAFGRWSSLSTQTRGEYFERLADLIDRDVKKIAHVETLDMAMLEESLQLRVIGRGARNFRAYADLARNYHARRWSSNHTVHVVNVEVRPGPRCGQHGHSETG